MAEKKNVFKTVLLGVLSIASYAFLLWKQKEILDLFTRGGVYFIFPVLTAFYFSLVHGTFAGECIKFFDLEVKKK
jgi:hypothetical protein